MVMVEAVDEDENGNEIEAGCGGSLASSACFM